MFEPGLGTPPTPGPLDVPQALAIVGVLLA
jgi:hypothetical protein